MSKFIGWIIGFTKVGKAAKSVQGALEGKKQMIASLAAAIPATFTIILKFIDLGTPYLVNLTSSPEFVAASAGWIGLFNAIKIEKQRNEVRQIQVPVAPPIEPIPNIPK